MNTLDKIIGYFSPAKGAARARARRIIRAYDGATQGRRGTAWAGATRVSANSEIAYALQPLRNRARELARNDGFAARMLDIFPAHVIGDGIRPVPNTGNDDLDKGLTDLWEEWQAKADVTGHLSFYGIQVLAVRSMMESGDIAVRYVPREQKAREIPLKLQLLEADFIDHFRDGLYGGSMISSPEMPSTVLRTRLGVGLGEYDEWQGLWLWPYHPGEMDTINQVQLRSLFVDKKELTYMFKMLRPGQVRGVSWFAPILSSSRELHDLMDAVNVKARVEACFAGFITNDDSSAPIMDANYTGIDPTLDLDNPTASISTLEPGMLKELRQGQDIKFASPTGTTQIDPVMMHNLRAIAAGVGCTYDQATGDLTGANYSSLRAGKIDFWRLISEVQKHTVIPQLCQPTWERFIEYAILSGRIKKRKGGYPVEWVVPSREAIDPKKDLDAEKNEVRAGRITPQQFIASKGNNWRNVLSDFASFNKAADDKGLVFDTDVRKVDQHGRQPIKAKDPNDPDGQEDRDLDDSRDDSDNDTDD